MEIDNSKKIKCDFETLQTIRKKLKEVNLLTPPKELNKYASLVGKSIEEIATTYSEDQLLEMQSAFQIWDDLQWEHGKTIVECAELALKDEYKPEFYGDFEKCRGLLFRFIIPKIRQAF